MKETPEELRSRTMRAVHSCDTEPELAVRRLLRDQGFVGYRIHCKKYPGKPDIAFIGRKKAIFIHGCFWHGHSCTRGRRIPQTNTEYWRRKISRNRQRDSENITALNMMNWEVLVVWECEIRDKISLSGKLKYFLSYQ